MAFFFFFPPSIHNEKQGSCLKGRRLVVNKEYGGLSLGNISLKFILKSCEVIVSLS